MSNQILTNRPMTAPEWGLLVALSMLWGGSYFFVGVAVRDLPPLTIVLTRVLIAALTLLLLCRSMRVVIPRSAAVWWSFLGMGLLNNALPFSLIVWGQTSLASGVASILNAATPLFTVVVAHFLTSDEKMTGGRLIGVIVGFLGVAVMIGASALQGLGTAVLAHLALLAAALSYAFAGIFGRRFRAMGVAPLATATGQLTASAAILIPITLWVDQPWLLAMPSAATLGALAGIALLSTAVAYVIYFRILSTAGATNLMLVTLLIPVSAILLGVLVLGEQLFARHIVGIALIAVGLAAIDGRPWIHLRRRLT